MPIPESDISILIPTYRYRDKVGRAVRSALASGAGEIIVIDDHGRDGTIEMLAQFDDPRLTVIENPVNLGLWENHLAGLSRATRPWIKFLQADDYMTDGALAAFAEAADGAVSVVWSCPTMEEAATGERTLHNRIVAQWRINSAELFALCLRVGWLLGRPTDVLLRADCIESDPALWNSGMSLDLVVGVIAATRGDVVLMPAGCVVNVNHAAQDARTQGPGKGLSRMVRSAEILHTRPEPEITRFATQWAAVYLRVATRTTLSAIFRRKLAPAQAVGFWARYARLALKAWSRSESRAAVREALRYRRTREGKRPPEIDALMEEQRRQPRPSPSFDASARPVK